MKKLSFDLNCPNCNNKLKIRVDEMYPGNSKYCPYCNTLIQFTGDDGRKIEKSLDDLDKNIKKLNSKMKFLK
jgi:hypothetical protein